MDSEGVYMHTKRRRRIRKKEKVKLPSNI